MNRDGTLTRIISLVTKLNELYAIAELIPNSICIPVTATGID
jgi:hypothetical protein